MRIEWKKVSVGLPESRWGHTSVNLPDNQGFLVFGGNGPSSPCNDIQVFQNNKWITIEATGTSPQPRYGHSATLFTCNSSNNSGSNSGGSGQYYQIIIYGGRASSKPFRDTKILEINSQGYFSWKSASKSTYEGRAGHSAIAYRQKELVVFGGYNNNKSKYYNNLQIFSLDTMEWKQQSCEGTIPSARAGHSAFLVYDRYMFIFGGFDGKRYYNDLYYMDLLPIQDLDNNPSTSSSSSSSNKHSFQWKKVDLKVPLPKARSGHSATMIQPDKVLIFGGCGSDSEFLGDIHILHIPSLVTQSLEFKFEQPNLSNQPLPFPRFKHTANFIDNKLFIFSGTGQGTLINDLLSFDIYDDNNNNLSKSTSNLSISSEIINNNNTSSSNTNVPAILPNNNNSLTTTTTTTSSNSNNSNNNSSSNNTRNKNSSNSNQHNNRLPLASPINNNVIQVNNMINNSNNLLPESLKFTFDNNLYQQKDVNKLANIINSSVPSSNTNNNGIVKKLEEKLKLEQKKRLSLEDQLANANQCIVKLKEQIENDILPTNKKELDNLQERIQHLHSDNIDQLSKDSLDSLTQLHLKSLLTLEPKKIEKTNQFVQKVLGEREKDQISKLDLLETELKEIRERNQQLEMENKSLQTRNSHLRGVQLDALELEDIIALENTIGQASRTISQAKDQLFIKQMALLRKEKEQLQEQSTCVICTVNPANVVLLPCRHSSICSKCSKKLSNCPLCRSFIENQIERFT